MKNKDIHGKLHMFSSFQSSTSITNRKDDQSSTKVKREDLRPDFKHHYTERHMFEMKEKKSTVETK